ncbi:hypothetical protein [Amantichitinum ursilacus]|uniref:Uncharacterized protein n=1 Tax=Amantichitinum ursilacus TaxID=857265 RepID=A0A0N0XK02_9NEIS|nr:hypothetical protein [Amantichitinum ursilacus]KPC53769.1 hypothetical protein WG78_07995 [Amantichitinum ursilacus]
MSIKETKAKYLEQNFKLRQRGIRLVSYRVPCCGATLEGRLASAMEEWESVATCPECGELYMKYTTDRKISAELLATK